MQRKHYQSKTGLFKTYKDKDHYPITFICKNLRYKSFEIYINSAKSHSETLQTLINEVSKFFKENIYKSEMLSIEDSNNTLFADENIDFSRGSFPIYFSINLKKTGTIFISDKIKRVDQIDQVDFTKRVKELKKQYHKISEIPPNLQKLEYYGQILQDNDILIEKGIYEGSQIILNATTRSNSLKNFVNVGNENGIQDIQFSKNAPEYRICTNGTNIEGICDNSDCKANGKQVICPIGTGVIDYLLSFEKFICPLCEQTITPVSCAFTSCFYKFAGTYIDVKTKKKITIKENQKQVGNFYRYFDPSKPEDGGSGIVPWIFLKIISESLESDNDKKKKCGICKKEIENEKDMILCQEEYQCFHKNCKDELENMGLSTLDNSLSI